MENKNGFRCVLFQTALRYAALVGLKSEICPLLSSLLPGWQTCAAMDMVLILLFVVSFKNCDNGSNPQSPSLSPRHPLWGGNSGHPRLKLTIFLPQLTDVNARISVCPTVPYCESEILKKLSQRIRIFKGVPSRSHSGSLVWLRLFVIFAEVLAVRCLIFYGYEKIMISNKSKRKKKMANKSNRKQKSNPDFSLQKRLQAFCNRTSWHAQL